MQHFYHKEVITHFKWDVIISSSLRLLLKVGIWYSDTDVKIENYSTMMESNYFFIKKYIWKHRAKKKDVLVIFILLQETKNSNLFDKSCTQGNVKCHIQHEESWLRQIVNEQVNYKWHYSPLIFSERNCARALWNPLRKK